ncbi:hypothetical protein Nepgr_029768 [Nepenthes gracilis]|uniref:Cyclin-dependent kinase inhibitor domain-containing protein n=1 Tax=Nepenthes gracilis TaxID=150966 RepID=A0AAD3TEA2_NEPGR|nr:hypothetical protein Nepgr_029768 [Nepenthes gracilis]
MGRYMKKGKITADVAVMEVSQPTTQGVRTRAKTLALQRNPELSYLQLRSRRLEKPEFQPTPPSPKQKQTSPQKQGGYDKQSNSQRTSSRLRVCSVNSGSVGSVSFSCSKNEEVCFSNFSSGLKRVAVGKEGETEEFVEASFGENNLVFDGTERSTRESTPCSFIRSLETTGTPCSAVRSLRSAAASQGAGNAMQRTIPTAYDLEEFFADVELQQQKLFIEKYNFDIVNDLPLPGRDLRFNKDLLLEVDDECFGNGRLVFLVLTVVFTAAFAGVSALAVLDTFWANSPKILW